MLINRPARLRRGRCFRCPEASAGNITVCRSTNPTHAGSGGLNPGSSTLLRQQIHILRVKSSRQDRSSKICQRLSIFLSRILNGRKQPIAPIEDFGGVHSARCPPPRRSRIEPTTKNHEAIKFFPSNFADHYHLLAHNKSSRQNGTPRTPSPLVLSPLVSSPCEDFMSNINTSITTKTAVQPRTAPATPQATGRTAGAFFSFSTVIMWSHR
jgi:hypothetical protein